MKTLLEYIKRGTKQVEKGIKKYGGTLDEKELSAVELIDHAIEEHVDAIFYMLKLREKLQSEKKTCKNCLDVVKGCTTKDECKSLPNIEICIRNKYKYWQPKKEASDKEVVKHCENCGCPNGHASACHVDECEEHSHWQPKKEGSE